jgi:site-specific recombinase XerD
LPRNIFSAQEVERILLLCDIDDPIGLRDRAIIEVLYSTGIRRMEVIALKLYVWRSGMPAGNWKTNTVYRLQEYG